MSHPSRNFMVYACTACGKRIFANPDHKGRRGRCPLCAQEHIVGGPRVAEEGHERRGAPRVKVAHARVELRRHRSAAASKADPLSQELYPLEDLSETGIGFMVRGVKDGKLLSGVAPPDIRVGDAVQVTLHQGGIERPKVYGAEVRRIVAPSRRGQVEFLIGAEFTGLSDTQSAELGQLVQSLLEG